ncbi:MAG TPA: zf-HC2 domain-containing protein [Kofleriaceae bacterium]|nr:zf-HC2 domain-containing protein [Kofleriaceae bacterium]
MTICESIDTLAMAYLDDELAGEERRELELHLTECTGCRARFDDERAEHAMIERVLAAPPAPDLLRARIGRALDSEDAAHDRAARARRSRWVLPGASILAAVAAIAVFVGVRPVHERDPGAVAAEAIHQQMRNLPLEVRGPNTGPWLRANFEPNVEPPQVEEPGTQLVGARLLPHGINGHDGAMLAYQINLNGSPFVLSVLIVRDVRDDEMADGDAVQVNGRTMHVVQADGQVMVTVVAKHMGYMFMAPELSTNELVWLVGRTTLVGAVW